jgi:ABC-type nitrate/sulfonate/bicarbonate transport system substrate-binding protein
VTPRLLALALLLPLVAACGGDDQTAAPPATTASAGPTTTAPAAVRKVTLVLDWTPNTNHAGFYLAQARGLYAAKGLDVTIIEPGEDGGLPQLATGNAQFAVSNAEALLPARQQGVDAVSVAAIVQHDTSSLIVPADRGVTRPRELAGKRYGGYGGELEQALVAELVRCDGGDPATIENVEVGNADYAVGLQRKDYDAVWIFDGWDLIRLRDLEGLDVVSFPFYDPAKGDENCLPDWYTPLLATSGKLIADDPELVRAFVEATAAGFEIARTDAPAAAAALLAAAPELDRELVERSAAYLASRYADAGRPWGRQDAAVWERFGTFLVDQKIVDGPLDTAGAFTDAFLPQ